MIASGGMNVICWICLPPDDRCWEGQFLSQFGIESVLFFYKITFITTRVQEIIRFYRYLWFLNGFYLDAHWFKIFTLWILSWCELSPFHLIVYMQMLIFNYYFNSVCKQQSKSRTIFLNVEHEAYMCVSAYFRCHCDSSCDGNSIYPSYLWKKLLSPPRWFQLWCTLQCHLYFAWPKHTPTSYLWTSLSVTLYCTWHLFLIALTK